MSLERKQPTIISLMTRTQIFLLTIRSILHLRPAMVYWRVHRAVKSAVLRLLERTVLAPRLFGRPCTAQLVRTPPVFTDAPRVEDIDLGARVFTFLHDREILPQGRNERREAVARKPLLWRFHYAYHDYLPVLLTNGRATAEEVLRFLREWSEDYPPYAPGARVFAWHPYVLSLRIDSWIRLVALLDDTDPVLTARTVGVNIPAGIERMARVLLRNLERGTRANHLMKNIKALLLAGLFLDTPTGRKAYRKGLSLLRRELREQVLRDGMHFERSPMYHTVMTSDLLDLVEAFHAAEKVPPEGLEAAAARMARFLRHILHPDGGIPLFNDSVEDFCLRPADVVLRAESLLPSSDLSLAVTEPLGRVEDPQRVSGLLVHRADELFVVFDGGMVGPDYQPGHAHCDTLSYEISWGGRRFVTDTGVFHYRESPERSYARSTAAHNTVRIDGKDQSETWKSFRVGARASVVILEHRVLNGASLFHAAHDGYTRFERGLLHERFLVVRERGWICIVDMLHGEGRHLVENIIHFHPALHVRREGNSVKATTHEGTVFVRPMDGENLHVFETEYYPAFGVRIPRRTTVFHAARTFPCVCGYTMTFGQSGAPHVSIGEDNRSVTIQPPGEEAILLTSSV
ncbi:MAG: alginate lyase family protein [Bacteroidota bacterium]|nr:alginate lyase family protein [Bacteroidota bacterium]